MRAACPEVEHVVLWGLCDAASAALTYWQSTRDARVAGMVLLNPGCVPTQVWPRRTSSTTTVQHLREAEFWKRLVSGRRRHWQGDALARAQRRDAPAPAGSGGAAQDATFPGSDGRRAPDVSGSRAADPERARSDGQGVSRIRAGERDVERRARPRQPRAVAMLRTPTIRFRRSQGRHEIETGRCRGCPARSSRVSR